MADLGRCRPPQSVAEVLGSCLLPVDFVRALSARFRLTGPNGTPLSTDLWKGRVHTFLGRLTAEAAPVLGLAERTLLGVDRDGEAHILHSLFSVPVGPYDPGQWLFGCRGELPAEGLPTITKIPVASFAAQRAFIQRLQTLYPGAYARGTTSTSEGVELSDIENLDVKLSARTHPVSAGVNPSPGGGDPPPPPDCHR